MQIAAQSKDSFQSLLSTVLNPYIHYIEMLLLSSTNGDWKGIQLSINEPQLRNSDKERLEIFDKRDIPVVTALVNLLSST